VYRLVYINPRESSLLVAHYQLQLLQPTSTPVTSGLDSQS
jgi:hypothetical protein